jgi:signal transduction histidine kinase
MFRPLTTTQKWVDGIIALFCLLLGLGFTALIGQPTLAYVVLLGMAVSLALHRASPGLALTLAWLTAVVQMLGMVSPQVSNIAILVVLYSTASLGSPRVRWLGLVSALGGGIIAAAYTSLLIIGAATTPGAGGLVSVLFDPDQQAQYTFTTAVGSAAGIFVLTLSWVLGLLARTGREARAAGYERYVAQQLNVQTQQEVIVEQERNRIARDMHDVVAHSLAVVIAQADGARYARASDPTVVDRSLETISSTAREALGDVRVLLAELRHRQTDGPQPMIADIPHLVEQMRSAGLDVRLESVGTPVSVVTGHQIAVYRIAQEGLTNALRHGAPGTPVSVRFDWRANGVLLNIQNAVTVPTAPAGRDDIRTGSVATVSGHIAPPTSPTSPTAPRAMPSVGHGVPGMRERATLAGGRLDAREVAPGVYQVTAFIPAAAHTPSNGTR